MVEDVLRLETLYAEPRHLQCKATYCLCPWLREVRTTKMISANCPIGLCLALNLIYVHCAVERDRKRRQVDCLGFRGKCSKVSEHASPARPGNKQMPPNPASKLQKLGPALCNVLPCTPKWTHNLTATPARREAGVLTHPLPRMDRERGRSSDAQLSFPAADLNFKALRVYLVTHLPTCPMSHRVPVFECRTSRAPSKGGP